ncbi:MAG: hypothetical protein AAGA30_13105 [Planctomycetota bacterium]
MTIWQNIWTVVFVGAVVVYVGVAIYVAWGGARDIRSLIRHYTSLKKEESNE